MTEGLAVILAVFVRLAQGKVQVDSIGGGQVRVLLERMHAPELDADRIRSIIFGLGLNINSNPNNYPEAIRPLATSLQAIHGDPLPLNEAAAAVTCAVEEAYAICIQGADTMEKLSEAWTPLDALAGQEVTAILKNAEVTGIAESGALLLQMVDGRKEAIRAGDVTLKK